jgi:hypothetical protein
LPLFLQGAALITLIIKSRDCLEKCDVSLGSVEQYLVHTTTLRWYLLMISVCCAQH